MKNEQNSGLNLPPQANSGQQPGHPAPVTAPGHSGAESAKPEPLAYDIKQSAAKLNVSTKTIRRLLRRGKLTSCKLLRKVLIPREQIENFLKLTCDKPNLN
jgi:excisionase family DNA binding protein